MPTLKWLLNEGNYYYFKDAPVHISSITLNKSSISLTTIGQTEQLTAVINPSEAVEKKVHWSSSDITVATVSQTGLVTCVTPGNCTITASCNGVSATCEVEKVVYIDILVVGGGGGGSDLGGGGGGGVLLTNNYSLTCNSVCVIVGSGGGAKQNGGDSCFASIIGYGGGHGGDGADGRATAGGSGGGAGYSAWWHGAYGHTCGGTGCDGQGFKGGDGYGCGSSSGSNRSVGGGGGGAGGQGGDVNNYGGGSPVGGNGLALCIKGEEEYYGAGGGGTNGTGQCGGCGGGGNYGCAATGLGGGGGGGGGAGHSGVVIVRYNTSCGYNMTGGCKYTCGDYTIHCFTEDGTLTVG